MLQSVRRAWRALVVVAAVCAAVPAVAAAEPIVSLGPLRGTPSAVTDAAGTLHAVTSLGFDQPGPDWIVYCRVPAGATACSTVSEIHGFPENLYRVKLLLRPQDGALVIVASGFDADIDDVTFVLTSSDGGTTWTPPRIAGRGLDTIDAAALTPDGSAVDTEDDNHVWQRVPLGGGVETRTVALRQNADGSDSGIDESPNVGYLGDGRAMTVGWGARLGVRARVLGGGDPYQNASWSPWSATRHMPGIAAFAGFGPNGTWLLTQGSVAFSGFAVWRWNGRRFAKPKSLGTIGGRSRSNVIGGVRIGNIYPPAFQQDAGGRLHAIWFRLCGRRRGCLVYRRNEPRGFGPPVVYPLAFDDAREYSIAANAGGSGWIVWSDYAAVSHGADHAVALVTPPRGSRVGSRRIRRARVTVPTHYACVTPGGRFVHRLLVSGRRSRLRIRSVRFSFDGGALPRVDRHAPFRVVYHLPFAAGTRHVARARVNYRGGHASVGRMIVMCP
jgi:hypothetical protein